MWLIWWLKKTSNIELSQLEYSELDFNAYLNSIFSNTTRVLNQMKTNNEYIFDNANDPFILNILLFLKEKKFFPEESGEFQINYSYNQRGNFGNICRFMYSINIKLNLSKSFRLSKNVKLKNHNLDKWFNNLIKALNKEFYKYLKMEHLNFFEDIVKNSVLKCSKKDYEKIFKFIIIKWRLNNFMGNFDWFKDILKVTPNFKDFKSNLKKENKKFFDQKISTIPQIKIEKFIKENWPIVQIDDLFNNINSFLSNHLNDENMEKYWLEKFKTRWNNIKIEISQKVNKINGKINKKTILEIEKIINQEIDLFKERFQLSYCNLYYELKKLEV